MTQEVEATTYQWPLISSPITITLISISYLYFVLRCGPKYMKNKQPYSLQTFIRFYNVFQIVANALIVYYIYDSGWSTDFNSCCTTITDPKDPKNNKIATLLSYLLCVKLIDYIETGLFVLRKKNRQISFLHLYHHISTVYICWLFMKYYPLGMATMGTIVNSGVHVIMYTYYFLASFGPGIQRYLQLIKPMITRLQIVQFWVLILYALLILGQGCPIAIVALIIMNLIINLVLFTKFYRENYKSEKSKAK